MTTTSVTGIFRTLHRHHQQLVDLQGRLDAGPRQLRACRVQLGTAEASLAEILDRCKSLRMQADQKQLQLRTAEQKIVDLERKLNDCKSNREYQTLGGQIAADRMASRVLEDEILELLERADGAKAEAAPAEQLVSDARERLATKERDVEQEKAEIEAEVARVSMSLEEVETELPTDVRSSYNRVVKGKGADGLAPVVSETCGGCHQKITGNMVSDLILGRLVACRSCGRLLYTGDGASPSDA